MNSFVLKHSSGEYEIVAGRGVIKQTGVIAGKLIKGRNCVIVSDSNVAPLYSDIVLNNLKNSGFSVHVAVIPAGEQSKNINMLNHLYSEFNNAGITRSDVIIALGGGVVGDLAGFSAATYMRGISIIQIPTSLLAQVDSSIGGKTGIDLEFGKNLAGLFHQPSAVISDTDCLKTLSGKIFADGMAEVIKHSCIRDKDMFDSLMKQNYCIEEIIYRNIEIKRDVVEKDEFESGLRMILNFGHTVGHGIEKAMIYECSHGQAVAAGMICAARIGEKMGITPNGTADKIKDIIRTNNLPEKFLIDADKVLKGITSDKKKLGSVINFVYLREIGDAQIIKLDMTDFEQVFRSVWNE